MWEKGNYRQSSLLKDILLLGLLKKQTKGFSCAFSLTWIYQCTIAAAGKRGQGLKLYRWDVPGGRAGGFAAGPWEEIAGCQFREGCQVNLVLCFQIQCTHSVTPVCVGIVSITRQRKQKLKRLQGSHGLHALMEMMLSLEAGLTWDPASWPSRIRNI